ncbi:PSME3-interacting protein isoform X2 [Palaemon carinicauda]|uniref:PSME3-interacting protein isoform X2 n=1 Tax=Palaemon carinicauda TaxID=392227 RepID=UPI0035B63360
MSSGFISEKDVAERRRVRQENWEKNRKEDDPLEAPEEAPPDNRSLYDRLQEQRQKKQEEYDEAHKKKVSAMQKNCAEEEMRAEMRAGEKKLAGGSGKKSHLSLLAGAIKRKHSDEDKTIDDEKASKIPNTSNASNGEKAEIHTSKPSTKSGFQCIAVLPGLGVYTDSSDSDNNVDSDSDEDDTQPQPPQQPRDITGRIVKAPAQCSQSS